MLLVLQSWVEWTKSVRRASNRLDGPCPVICADLRKVVVLSSGGTIWVLQWLQMSIPTTEELGSLWLIHAI